MRADSDPVKIVQALQILVEEGVSFLVIGGVALNLYGTGHVTDDLDVLFEPTPENAEALLRALQRMEGEKYKGGVTPGKEITLEDLLWAIEEGGTVRCSTNSGDIDCMGAIPLLDFPQFYELRERAESIEIGGVPLRLISLEDLAENKRRVRRVKDVNALPVIADIMKLRSDWSPSSPEEGKGL